MPCKMCLKLPANVQTASPGEAQPVTESGPAVCVKSSTFLSLPVQGLGMIHCTERQL